MIDTLHLVLVDDNPDDRALIIRELHREFPTLQIVHISDNASLDKMLAEGTCGLVITDYQLLWTTGLGILQTIKQADPTCPVIMYTRMGSAETAVAAMKAGADDYVLKAPRHCSRLLNAVRSALEKARHRRSVQAPERPNWEVSEPMSPHEQSSSLEKYLANVAHEFAISLSMIRNEAATLCQVLGDTPNLERAEKIARAAEHCVELMRDCVASARPDAPERAGDQVNQVGREARILVVDDEPGIAEVLAEVLQLDGHVVESVGNGEAALTKLATVRYDLILSDVRMPDLDGPTLYHEVQRRYPDLAPFFIFLTGDVMSPEVAQLLSHTSVPCLSKPFTLEMVRGVVHRVLTDAHSG